MSLTLRWSPSSACDMRRPLAVPERHVQGPTFGLLSDDFPAAGHQRGQQSFPLGPFGFPVSHQIQRFLLSSLPAERAIQHCAPRRSLHTGP